MRKNHKVLMRRAKQTDARDLWYWRNDGLTRRNSLTTKKNSFNEHKSWLAKSLRNRFRKIYIATLNGIKVGTARLDFEENKVIQVSINIHPEYRKKGLGKQILCQIGQLIRQKYAGRIQKAIIKLSNVPSERLFSSAGFIQIQAVPELKYSIWIRR